MTVKLPLEIHEIIEKIKSGDFAQEDTYELKKYTGVAFENFEKLVIALIDGYEIEVLSPLERIREVAKYVNFNDSVEVKKALLKAICIAELALEDGDSEE